MPSLFRKTITRYVRPDGKRSKKADPEARKVTERSEYWYARIGDADGILREHRLKKNKTAAGQQAAELVRKAEYSAVGLIGPHDEHLGQPLKVHLEAFRRHLEAKQVIPRQVALTVNRVKACLARVVTLKDLSAQRVAEYLSERRKSGLSIQSSNHYLACVKAFANWAVRDRRLPLNPFAHLAKLNSETDIRRERRELHPAELNALLAAARLGVSFKGTTGESRAVLYSLAVLSGLRASELHSLTPESFDLETDQPCLTVEAGYSKHRRKDVLPLHGALVPMLREFIRNRPQPEAVANPNPWKRGSQSSSHLPETGCFREHGCRKLLR